MGLSSTVAANFSLKGDTHAPSLYYFNILPHSLQRLSYSSVEVHSIRESVFPWPSRFVGSYGIGHREAITPARHMGLYCFIDSSLDAAQVRMTPTALDDLSALSTLQNRCYDRFFVNLNIGFELTEQPVQINIDFAVPLSALFTGIEKDYLPYKQLQGNAIEKVLQAFPLEKRADQCRRLQNNIENNFYSAKNQSYQRYYYLEEGSYGVSIKARYHCFSRCHILSGIYYFLDPYRNHTLGGSVRLDYACRDGLILYTQYTYDAVRSYTLRSGIQFTAEDRRLKHIPSYRALWYSPNRHLSPYLVRSHQPRPVNQS